jgi:magnesium transporter
MASIRVAVCRDKQLRQGGPELIDEWRAKSDDKLWVDIEDPTSDVLEPLLEERFGFHELAAEDSLSETTLPKYDRFPEYDFFIFRAVENRESTYKVASFLGRNFLFTIHRPKVAAIESTLMRLPSDVRLLHNGPDFLLYSIVDQMVDGYFPLLDKIEECVDDLQEDIFKDAQPYHLDDLLHQKREINVLRRQSLPQRELLNQLSRGDAQFIQRDSLIYFRDIYDHMFRISETIDVERDMMAGTMEAYLSVVANRTNEIMKVLTVFSAIMLPLTLIAGIYGMNFQNEPELHWHFGYFYALGLMAITAIGMLIWFRRKGWIGPHARRRARAINL